jgi:hypothetical protein
MNSSNAFNGAASSAVPQSIDAVAAANVIAKYAAQIGCTPSNVTGAVAWGIRNGHDTLSAIRAGKHRADVLCDRQLPSQSHQPQLA